MVQTLEGLCQLLLWEEGGDRERSGGSSAGWGKSCVEGTLKGNLKGTQGLTSAGTQKAQGGPGDQQLQLPGCRVNGFFRWTSLHLKSPLSFLDHVAPACRFHRKSQRPKMELGRSVCAWLPFNLQLLYDLI